LLRLLHTADWHLGQTFHNHPREHEHQQVLDWLLQQLDDQQVDALIIAGDVFDSLNPPIQAQRQFYHFLAEARRRRPRLATVVIAGNHDSGGRLEAPWPLLAALGVRVVGALPRTAEGGLDPARLLVPLADAEGQLAALCLAVPYLRPADLPGVPLADPGTDGDQEAAEVDPLIEGMRQLHQEALALARARLPAGVALIATGHCYLAGGQLSQLSERKILGGNLHALPPDLYPDDLSYVALGHLHRAQAVAGRESVRYSGSPLPLALDEDGYRHQVLLVELEGPEVKAITPLLVPRPVAILRLPAGGAPGTLEQAEAAVSALPPAASAAREHWPYLELALCLDQPRPFLRAEIEALLEGKAARLVRLAVTTDGSGRALADGATTAELSALTPEEVFRRCWLQRHQAEPSPALQEAFLALVQQVQEGEA